MQDQTPEQEHLTDFERAICYYALPKMVNPITLGVVVAYAVCLLEAAGALAYGLAAGHDTWTMAGTVSLAALVLFGLVVFTGRALVNEVRRRRLMAAARGVPDALRAVPDIPDPFANHVLLSHPTHHPRRHFECHEEGERTHILVDRAPGGAWWRLTTREGAEVCRVKVEQRAQSFALSMGGPGRLSVYKDDKPIALIRHRFSLAAPHVDIESPPDHLPYTRHIHGDSILFEKRRVGRIYRLRGYLYLDIERAVFDEAILGYFATLT